VRIADPDDIRDRARRAAGAVLEPDEAVEAAAWARDRSRPAGLAEIMFGALARPRQGLLVALTGRRLLGFDAQHDAPGPPVLDEPRAKLRTVASRSSIGGRVVEVLRSNGELLRFDFPGAFDDEARAIRDALRGPS
jgi:hypothetical protein